LAEGRQSGARLEAAFADLPFEAVDDLLIQGAIGGRRDWTEQPGFTFIRHCYYCIYSIITVGVNKNFTDFTTFNADFLTVLKSIVDSYSVLAVCLL